MKVTTIDGGFRGKKGLAALTTAQRLTVSERFDALTAPIYEARRRFMDVASRAGLTAGDIATIEQAFTRFDARVQAHWQALDSLQSESQLAEWRSTAETIAAEARPLADRVLVVARDEASTRPWKVALTALGLASVVGFVWWAAR